MGSDVLDGYKHFIATEKRYRKKPWTFCNDCSHGIWNPHLHRSTCKFDKTLEWCELWHEWAEYVREFERRNKRKERTCKPRRDDGSWLGKRLLLNIDVIQGLDARFIVLK